MRINQILFILFITTLTLFVSGCSDNKPQVPVPLDTSIIRAYQQGDTVTATMTLTNTNTGQTTSGEINFVVGGIVPNPFGINCRSFTISGEVAGPSGTVSISSTSLSYQDDSNSMYDCGEFNDNLGRYVFLTDTATTPNGILLERKSPVELGDTTTGVSSFDDGTWSDCTRTVQAIENVSVPLGSYESYRVSDTCLYSDGSNYVGTVWVVPSIFELKDSSKLYDMGVFDIVITVKSYNFN